MSVIGACILWGFGLAVGAFIFTLTLFGFIAMFEVLQRGR